MPARINIVHGDQIVREALAAAFRSDGHQVTEFDDRSYPVGAPRPADAMEFAIFQSTGDRPGIRLRVTGFPPGDPYAGPLGSFVPDPVTAAAVVAALRLMLAGQA